MTRSTEPPLESVPFLTASVPGIGGRVKTLPEDFLVEELPLYQPSGAGEHLYLWVEKRDISSEQLLDHLSRRLKVRRGDIGMAGLKDRRAVTRQYVSVPCSAEPRLSHVDADGVRVLSVTRHGNKLRTGHLAGNRFDVLIRDPHSVPAGALPRLVERLRDQGCPNAYGDQRFGIACGTLSLGLGLLRGHRSEREIEPRRRRFLLRLALSSVQSWLFNHVLTERIRNGTLQTVEPGDVMQVIASGGCFIAVDAAAEQARCERRETVITGPIFGPRMKSAAGIPGEREQRVLATAELSTADFQRFGKLTPGARRPLVVYPGELSATATADGIRLRFTLPPGAYATVLLQEVMKLESGRDLASDLSPTAADESESADFAAFAD